MNRREADIDIRNVNCYVCVCGCVDSISFYDINILFRNCSDSMFCFSIYNVCLYILVNPSINSLYILVNPSLNSLYILVNPSLNNLYILVNP